METDRRTWLWLIEGPCSTGEKEDKKQKKKRRKKIYYLYRWISNVYSDMFGNEGGEVHGLSVVGKVRENGTSAVTTRV